MSKHIVQLPPLDGSGFTIGIVRASWNKDIIDGLFESCLAGLRDSGVAEDNISVISVPGTFELPLAAHDLIEKKKVDAVIVLSCLIKGETMHFEYISEGVTQGLMRVMLDTKTPIIFGVLPCLTYEQAVARSSGEGNYGHHWGQSAVHMATLQKATP